LDNIYVTNKKYNMYKLKLTNNKQLLKLNNNIYLPFLIHNLPKNYNKFNISNIIKIGTQYILIVSSLLNNKLKTILIQLIIVI